MQDKKTPKRKLFSCKHEIMLFFTSHQQVRGIINYPEVLKISITLFYIDFYTSDFSRQIHLFAIGVK